MKNYLQIALTILVLTIALYLLVGMWPQLSGDWVPINQ